MFSIYGESGRVFRGAMEDLWRVEALRAVARTRRLEAQHEAPLTTLTEHTGVAAAHPNPRASTALSAYAQAAGAQPQRHPLSRVADVMSRNVITLDPELPVLEAWQRLVREGVGQAPVTSVVGGTLVGLLTRAELLSPERLPQPDASSLVWRALLMQPVSQVMLSPVPAVDEGTDLRRVARVLLDTHLPGLPVVTEDGRVGGFISRSDILRAVVHDPPLDLWS